MITQLLLAAALASSAGAASPAPAVAASTAAVAAAYQRFAARCAQEPLAVDDLMSDPSFRADLEYAPQEVRPDLADYAACRVLQGASAACAALETPGRPVRGDAARCQTTVAEDRFVFLAVHGGDTLPACRAMLELDGRKGPAVDKECAAMTGLVRSAGPALTAEQIRRARIGPPESSEDTRIFWSGSAADCDGVSKDAVAQRVCRERAALVAGLRTPSLCAASPFCQALATKWPGACDPLRARFSRALCSRISKDLAAEKSRLAKEQEALKKQVKEKADAQAAAAAAVRAKAEAALARSKAEQLAAEEKVRKNAETQAAKKAAVEAAVKAKAESEARKAAEAKAKVERKGKPQFRKGEPMQTMPAEVQEFMKAVEEGRPPPKPKPKPKPKQTEGDGGAPAEQ